MQWTTGIVSAISKTSDITEVSTPDGDFERNGILLE